MYLLKKWNKVPNEYEGSEHQLQNVSFSIEDQTSKSKLPLVNEQNVYETEEDEIDLGSIKNEILSRFKYKYSFKNLCCSWVPSIRCFKRGRIWKRTSAQNKYNILFKNGMEKIHSEIDCVDIVMSLRKLKLITRVLLNK